MSIPLGTILLQGSLPLSENYFIIIAKNFPHTLENLILTTQMSTGMKARAVSVVHHIKDLTIALPMLERFLQDPQPMVQEGALQALERIGLPAKPLITEYSQRTDIHKTLAQEVLYILEDFGWFE